MKNLKATVVQPELFWEDKEKNLDHLRELIKGEKAGSTDIIILPEMFNTGFSMNAGELAENMNGKSVKWLSTLAKEKGIVICGSLIVKDKENFYNRFLWVDKEGKISWYDKRHLFRMAGEEKTFSEGKNKITLEFNNWKICPLVCYDLRFPVWSRNKNNEFDILIYVANWPEKRYFAWKQLLIARAIENQCYVIGVNRVGVDGNGINYSGGSVVIDPKGEYIMEAPLNKEEVITVELNYQDLLNWRKIFPAWMDADNFNLI